MVYYIDGYNLIFSATDSKQSLLQQRRKIIRSLQKAFALLHLQGTIVFDGTHRHGEESGLSYASPLVIAYAAAGQSADAYILEKLEWEKTPHLITVVTNDRGLARSARALGAKTQANEPFIRYLKAKQPKKMEKEIEPKESQYQIDRLLKIFEGKHF